MNEETKELAESVQKIVPVGPQTAAGEVARYAYKLGFWALVAVTVIKTSELKNKGA